MKNSQLKIVAALLCATPSLAFSAADSTLDVIVVTATRTAQPLSQSLTATTVITRQDIQDSHSADVPSVLKNVAGVEIYQSGGVGQQSSLFMRGSNSNHVLILLDGVRINSATTGSTAIDQLMLDQIERIEVVRGNVSSLYGSEAIGGVIQIFTRHGRGKPAFNLSGGIGSHNTQRVAAGFGGAIASNDFNLQVSKFKTDGISSISPNIVSTVNPDKDGYDNTSLSANVRHFFSADNSLSGAFFRSEGNVQFDNSFALPTDVNSSKSIISKVALVSDNRLSAMWQSELQFAQGEDELKTMLNGLPDPFGGYVRTRNTQLSWQNTLLVNAHANVLLGVEELQQKVSSDTLYAQTERNINSLFGGYTGDFGAHQLQVNLRQDNYSDSGTASTGLLGYGYAINQSWRITASASTAFKSPTFTDLYGPAAWGSNAKLKPERSRNKEVGMHYANDGQRVDLAYFDNRTSDLIASDSTYTLQNLNSARSDGVEVGYVGQFGETTVKGALTVQSPRDTQTDLVLLRRAKSFSSLGVTRQVGAWTVGGEWQHSGTREDIDINTFTRTTLGSYDLMNLTANYALNKRFDLSLRADNVFNRGYMLAHGYDTPGRTLFVGVNYRQ